MTDDKRIPIHILTGFLGSGKTTLLRNWLADPALRDTAVIINEFGEVGIDNLLVRKVTDEVFLLGSGCICCTVRDSLAETLAELDGLAKAGTIERFARVAVETTGLANPAPIVRTILDDPKVTPHFRLGATITTVDAQHGAAMLERRAEGTRQVVLADRLIVTKCDLVAEGATSSLARTLARLNPAAQIVMSRLDPPADPNIFFSEPMAAQSRGAVADAPEIDHAIGTFTVVLDRPVIWARFMSWLELLLVARGDSILRMKGFVWAAEVERPILLQGVHEVLYPPETLPEWPDGVKRTELVFIGENITRRAVERSLFEYLGWRVDAHRLPAPEPTPMQANELW
jgi:G3E family GTPase